ncbi:unnamed protein product [Caenorhabditis brenneri]
MIIPGAMAALGYLVVVIALAVCMSLVCSMFAVSIRRQPQAQRLISSNTSLDTNNSLHNYNTALGAPTN